MFDSFMLPSAAQKVIFATGDPSGISLFRYIMQLPYEDEDEEMEEEMEEEEEEEIPGM